MLASEHEVHVTYNGRYLEYRVMNISRDAGFKTVDGDFEELTTYLPNTCYLNHVTIEVTRHWFILENTRRQELSGMWRKNRISVSEDLTGITMQNSMN